MLFSFLCIEEKLSFFITFILFFYYYFLFMAKVNNTRWTKKFNDHCYLYQIKKQFHHMNSVGVVTVIVSGRHYEW